MEQLIENALSIALKKSDQLRCDAAYGGERHDGGASNLRNQIEAYRAGIEGKIPSFLEPYIKEARRLTDPDYVKYQKLKSKFE